MERMHSVDRGSYFGGTPIRLDEADSSSVQMRILPNGLFSDDQSAGVVDATSLATASAIRCRSKRDCRASPALSGERLKVALQRHHLGAAQ